MRRERHKERLGQGGNFFHLSNPTGLAAVGLQNVDAALLQIRHDAPDRAVALAQCDDLTAAVAKELHLDMTRAHDQFLEEHAGVAEMTAGEAAHAVERSA